METKAKSKSVKFPRKEVVAVKTYTPSSKGSSPFLRREHNESSPQYKQRVEQAKLEDQEARADFVRDYAKSFAIVPASINIPKQIPNLKSMKMHMDMVETHAIHQKKTKPKMIHTHRKTFANANRLKHGWAMQSLFWDKKYIGDEHTDHLKTKKKPAKLNQVVSIITNIFTPHRK